MKIAYFKFTTLTSIPNCKIRKIEGEKTRLVLFGWKCWEWFYWVWMMMTRLLLLVSLELREFYGVSSKERLS